MTVIASSQDKSKFILSFPEDVGWQDIYFYRMFEKGTTGILRRILEENSIVFDIGANIGWYTILMAKICTRGQCHAFEPVPFIFEKLRRNCFLNNLGDNLFLNQLALGEKETTVELHTFDGLSHAHSSLSTLGRDDYSIHKAYMTTIDEYIKTNAIKRIDFIKIDVEGAELSVLQGAKTVFYLDPPPIWVIEMNKETANKFGYSSTDLLRFLERHGSYGFYRIVGAWRDIVPMKSVEDYEHGDNVLCIPSARQDKLRILCQNSNCNTTRL